MKVLGVDTATSIQSLALVEDDRVVLQSDRDAGGKHGKLLISGIDGLLHAAGWTLGDLDGFAVSIGPGSFTGLRVGLATMMGFRMVAGLPIAAVPTLYAMAYTLRNRSEDLCPVLRARTGEVYWACYRSTDGKLVQLTEDQVGGLAQLAASLRRPTLVFGEGWVLNREAFRHLVGPACTHIHEVAELGASAVSVALLGCEKLRRGEQGDELVPRYVQRAEAEVVRARREAAASAGGLGG